MKFFRNIVLLYFVTVIPLFSADVRELSLKQYLSLVLKNNLNIKTYKINKDIAKSTIDKYLSEFDPSLEISIDKSFSKEFTGSKLESEVSSYIINKNSDLNFSLSKKILTGGNLQLTFTNNRYKTNSNWSILNPAYTSYLTLELTQPLLKNFGVSINKSEIKKAENNLKKTEAEITNDINNEILDAIYKYFDLVYAYKYLNLNKEYLKLAENTHEINKKKVKVGLLPQDVLLESESEILSRKEALIKAKQELNNISDELKNKINDINSSYVIIPNTLKLDDAVLPDLQEGIKSALKNRFEIKEIDTKIENAKIDNRVAKNQILPSLDVNVFGGLSGKGENPRDEFDRLYSNKYHKWGLGLKFAYPLGNREAKANYKIAKLQLLQLKNNKKNIENNIIMEVKKSFRNLKILKKKIEADKKSCESSKEKLNIEEKKYKNGLSNIFKVFSYQTDYISEKVKLLKAEIDYFKEYIHWNKITGKNLFQVN